MKKLMIPVIAAIAVLGMVGCSNDPEVNVPDKGQVEIKANAGVAVITKAPVNGLAQAITDVAFAKVDAAETADWTSPVQAPASIAATTGVVTFTPALYYPQNGDKTFLIGYMPKTGSTLGSDEVTWTGMDGTQDVMYAAVVSGNKVANKAAALAPAFAHKLTQLNFKVKKDASFDGSLAITSITIVGAELPASMKLSDGAVTFAAAADLAVAGTSLATVTETLASSGDPMMIKAGMSVVTLKIVAGGVTYDASVTLTTVAGSAHDIELTFTKVGVTATATVAEWTPGTPGTGEVQ